jgi:hypothetical protein
MRHRHEHGNLKRSFGGQARRDDQLRDMVVYPKPSSSLIFRPYPWATFS